MNPRSKEIDTFYQTGKRTLRQYFRPAFLTFSAAVLAGYTTAIPVSTPEAAHAPAIDSSPTMLVPTSEPTLIPSPTSVRSEATPVLPAETQTPKSLASTLPLCLIGDPKAPAFKNPRQAIFPREPVNSTPESAEQIMDLFQQQPSKVKFLSSGSNIRGFNLDQNKQRLLETEKSDPHALVVNYAGLGFSSTKSQIIDQRPDSIMNMYIQPGAFSDKNTYSDIYAPFKDCGNGIGMSMTLRENTLFLVMDYWQPRSVINEKPTQRRYLFKIPSFGDLHHSGALLSAETVSGIYVGKITLNGRSNPLEFRL